MQTLLTLCGVTGVVWILGGLLLWRAWRAFQRGQVNLRGTLYNRQQQPTPFFIITCLYTFGGLSFTGWGFLNLGLAALFALQQLF